jgi:hypothetical protein
LDEDFVVPDDWESPSLSGNVVLSYDDTAFYLWASFEDDTQYQKNTGYSVWKGDCIQVGIAPPKASQDAVFSEINMGINESSGPVLVRAKRGPETIEDVENLRFNDAVENRMQRNDEAGETTYAVKLPWELFAVAPETGALGLVIGVSDMDGEGSYGHLTEWGDGMFKPKDASSFALVSFDH